MKICKTASSFELKILLFFLDFLILGLIKLVSTVQYNQPCTFSSGTCDWSIGRRWHVVNLDDDDKGLKLFFISISKFHFSSNC